MGRDSATLDPQCSGAAGSIVCHGIRQPVALNQLTRKFQLWWRPQTCMLALVGSDCSLRLAVWTCVLRESAASGVPPAVWLGLPNCWPWINR